MPRPRAIHLAASVLAVLIAGALSACAPATATPDEAPATVRVPQDAPTISEAVSRVREGGLVLVSPGTYREQVLVSTPRVTVRGLDRNDTVVDAEGTRPYGIVAIADGVSIENLSVTRALYYGVLVTGLHDESGPSARGVDGYSHLDPEKFPPIQGYSISHVTAYDNGLYGIYAFDSQHGVIRDSYASGSADSGIYVGQCRNCDVLVTGNVAENNAVGFENANASDSVYVVGNRFTGNRVGMTFLSNYQEAFSPQRGNAVVGNLVSANDRADSPAQAEGGFGIGIGISGGTENAFSRNRIAANPRAGVLLAGTEDLSAKNNVFDGDVFEANAVDVANVSGPRAPASGNCVKDAATLRVLPADLLSACPGSGAQPSIAQTDLPAVTVPPGVSFLKVAPPPRQPDMTDLDAPARVLPATVGAPALDGFGVPGLGFLADRARS